MVKNLILIRHAEATEGSAGLKDIERQLTAKGYSDAPRIGRHLFDNQVVPDLILSSTAQRARATADLLAEQLRYALNQIKYLEELYNASVRSLLAAVSQTHDSLQTVLLVGHNPAISYLSEYLSGEEIGNMVPASYVHLSFELDAWQEVSQDTGRLILYQPPESIVS